MMKKIGLAVLALLVLFLGYAAFKPSHYRVAREVSIFASAEKIYPFLNESKRMDSWNPWTKLDPAVKVSFSGPEAGVGSRSDWTGGKQLGTGSAIITESVPFSHIRVKLEYIEPFKMVQDVEYTLRPEGAANTIVVWAVEGDNNFIGRIMCTFNNMDKMVGGIFEQGLANLKTLAEK